jgi:hypothetical protein
MGYNYTLDVPCERWFLTDAIGAIISKPLQSHEAALRAASDWRHSTRQYGKAADEVNIVRATLTIHAEEPINSTEA